MRRVFFVFCGSHSQYPISHRRNAVPYPIALQGVPYPISNSVSVARRAFCLSEKAIRKDAAGLYMNVIMRRLTLKDECSPKRRLDRKTEESITSSARAGTRKRKELSIWLKRPTNVLYLYTLISYQSATLALPLRYLCATKLIHTKTFPFSPFTFHLH